MGHADVRSPIGLAPVHAPRDHRTHHQPPPSGSQQHDHSAHGHMVDEFRRRFWVSLALTVPVLATSEMLQHLLGLRGVLAFPGDQYVAFAFASAVYFYGERHVLVAREGEHAARSEEHTSELQSRLHLVCRLLLEKKKNKTS